MSSDLIKQTPPDSTILELWKQCFVPSSDEVKTWSRFCKVLDLFYPEVSGVEPIEEPHIRALVRINAFCFNFKKLTSKSQKETIGHIVVGFAIGILEEAEKFLSCLWQVYWKEYSQSEFSEKLKNEPVIYKNCINYLKKVLNVKRKNHLHYKCILTIAFALQACMVI